MKPDWRQSCVRLWGDDWVTPLADVLGVDRKTVTRWKMGRGAPPEAVTDTLEEISHYITWNYDEPTAKVYGSLLRRLSRGETIKDVTAWFHRLEDALGTLEADIGSYTSIPALAKDVQKLR